MPQEKWQHNATLPDQEQLAQIFASYVELGKDGQQVGTEPSVTA